MRVAVTWSMCGYVDIPSASNLKEAMEMFNEEADHIKLPQDGVYVDGSFELSTQDEEEMEAFCNLAPKTYDQVFYRDEYNFKTIVFEGTTEECEEYVRKYETYTTTDGDEYDLEIWSQS